MTRVARPVILLEVSDEFRQFKEGKLAGRLEAGRIGIVSRSIA
jgi:hypothetical protein